MQAESVINLMLICSYLSLVVSKSWRSMRSVWRLLLHDSSQNLHEPELFHLGHHFGLDLTTGQILMSVFEGFKGCAVAYKSMFEQDSVLSMANRMSAVLAFQWMME